jgi:carboxypeptidase Taq
VISKLNELKALLGTINDLRSATAVLEWDQVTYMPPGGKKARARQISTLGRLAHERLVDPVIGHLLDDLRSYEASLPYDSDEASLIRVVRRDYEKAIRVPAEFMAEYQGHVAASTVAWAEARPANDFAAVLPYLDKMIDLSRQFADFFPGYESPADALIDYFAREGLTARQVQDLFAALRRELLPMVQAIRAQAEPDDAFLSQRFPAHRQLSFGLQAVQCLGYDMKRGREDLTHHPFTTTFSLDDVRITTRVRENNPRAALFATLHEAGHGLYEQGIKPELEGTPLARGTSSGTHESQSRLWENLVGRSWEFWEFFYPRLQATFPQQLGAVSLDGFYHAINKVRPSLIRVEADEVTYNLHIMLRFDLEQELLAGRLAAADTADAYRARFEADLGIAPPDDRDGVMQDIHWFGHFLGAGYLGYTLGNIMSAQFFEAALRTHPEIPDEMRQGEFGTLLRWLRENLYQHGRKFAAPELIERVTGQPLSIEPYVRYLRRKYGRLYRL